MQIPFDRQDGLETVGLETGSHAPATCKEVDHLQGLCHPVMLFIRTDKNTSARRF
jgi:hypothetical protein